MITYEVDSRSKDKPLSLYIRHWDGIARPDYTRLFDVEYPYDTKDAWANLEWIPYSMYSRRIPGKSYNKDFYREVEVALDTKTLKEFLIHLISSTDYINYVEITGYSKESKTWKLYCYIHNASYKEFW